MAIDPDVQAELDILTSRLEAVEAEEGVLRHAQFIDADDTASSIQTKIDAGPVIFMEDVFVADPLIVDSPSYIDLNGYKLSSSASAVFRFVAGAWDVFLENGELVAQNGHVFDVEYLSNSTIQRTTAQTWKADKSVWRQDDGQAYDVLVQGGHWKGKAGMTEPIVYISRGHFNTNTFQRLRFTNNASITPPNVPVIYLQKQEQNWYYQNVFRDMNFEQPNAGAVHAYGIFGTLFENLGVYDTGPAGLITDHLWMVDASTTGLKSVDTTFKNVTRVGNGQAVSGIHDIHIEGHYSKSLIVDNCGGSSGANVAHRIKNNLSAEIRGGNWKTIVTS